MIKIPKRILDAWNGLKDKYEIEDYSLFYFTCGYNAGEQSNMQAQPVAERRLPVAYVVQNSDGEVMQVCSSNSAAVIAVKFGRDVWEETWTVNPMDLDTMPSRIAIGPKEAL